MTVKLARGREVARGDRRRQLGRRHVGRRQRGRLPVDDRLTDESRAGDRQGDGGGITDPDPVGQDRAQGGHRIVGEGLDLEGPDVDGPVAPVRAKPVPRWSVVRGLPLASTASDTLPALMAGLPARSAMVWVGPPLLASVPRSGLATPTRLPWMLLRQAAGAPGADHVERAGRGDRSGDVVRRCTGTGSCGVRRDDRVVQGGRAAGDIHSASHAAAAHAVVGDGAVDGRESAGLVVDAAAVSQPSCPREWNS